MMLRVTFVSSFNERLSNDTLLQNSCSNLTMRNFDNPLRNFNTLISATVHRTGTEFDRTTNIQFFSFIKSCWPYIYRQLYSYDIWLILLVKELPAIEMKQFHYLAVTLTQGHLYKSNRLLLCMAACMYDFIYLSLSFTRLDCIKFSEAQNYKTKKWCQYLWPLMLTKSIHFG